MLKRLFAISVFALCVMTMAAEDACPKWDMRASWFQTVWRGDFPTNYGASAQVATQQKAQLDRYVGYFDQANMNVMCFQVRTMCDAFYQSSFPEEAWSQWLTGERGLEPTYDPLQYLISSAHAKGIEVHAWINPYRYSTSSSTHGTLPTDYPTTHPDWLIDCGGTYILNPGLPEVRQRIVDVVMDIVNRYDVDGIIFDDYFYQSGMQNSYDDSLYLAFNPDGLDRADWRREQVNLMVRDVNAAIKAAKPWVRFGIGPAGVAASSQTVADKYGVPACPSGYDWQYSGIYSDPLAWVSRRYIDYISPQVYWRIGATEDYAKIVPWWYVIAHKFGRHCFISSTLSSLTQWGKSEFVNQINLNRASSKDGVSGMVFFNTHPWVNNLIPTLVDNVYQYKSIPPAMTWQKAPDQDMVTDLNVAAATLTWDYTDSNVRYGIYVMPKSVRNNADSLVSARYLVDMAYDKSYTLPEGVTSSTHSIAVTVIDRYGFEYAPRFVSEPLKASVTPSLLFPADGDSVLLPNALTWQPVPEAMSYIVQIATTASFDSVLVSAMVDTCVLLTQNYSALDGKQTCYWRVRANAANTPSQWSAVRSFRGKLFSINSPEDGEGGVSPTPFVGWDDAGQGAVYTLELATSTAFKTSEIVYSETTTNTSTTIPHNTLKYSYNYYARVCVVTPFFTVTSPVVTFTTKDVEMVPPVILSPENGADLTAPAITILCNETPNNGYRFELSTSPSFPNRTNKRAVTGVGVNTYTFEGLTDGTYYARAAVILADGTPSDYSEAVMFTYHVGTSVKQVESSAPVKYLTPQGYRIRVAGKVYDLLGNELYTSTQ